MTIGNRIRDKRMALGLSVDDLAALLGKNRATVYRYENGNIENLPIGVLEPLAHALQTTPGYLIGWTEDDYDWDRDLDNRLAAVAGDRWEELVKQNHGDKAAAWKDWKNIERDQAAEAARSSALPAGATLFNPQQVAPLLGCSPSSSGGRGESFSSLSSSRLSSYTAV